MSLPAEEWLPLAKRLPVGQTRRFRHRSESRNNLAVWNREDGWGCWCHACGEGGFMPKEFVKVQSGPPERPAQGFPADFLRREEWGRPLEQRVATFLATKGLDLTEHTRGIPLGYSALSERLVIGCYSTTLHWLGRSIGQRQPKWVAYSTVTSGYAPYAIPPGAPDSGPWVITEDYLSAVKVQAAVPSCRAVASLGTKLQHALVLRLLADGAPVLVFYDGDPAGRKGSASVVKRLRGVGLRARETTPPAGADPKDLQLQAIRDLIGATE